MIPHIVRLDIKRYRGLREFIWTPAPGVNVILGGGDVAKSTILEAIALLFYPTNPVPPAESDFWRRELEEFSIEALLRLPDDVGIHHQRKQAWPWVWNGREAAPPDVEGARGADEVDVYRVRVRGTPDFEILHEIVQPNDETDYFSAGLRQAIGVVRLAGEDRNERDLRLVQGSALERLVADPQLRPRIASQLASHNIAEALKEEGRQALASLQSRFVEKGLPQPLGLGLTGGPGLSVNALINLTAVLDGVELPLSSWGSGTRRLASLAIAGARHQGKPIVLVDELERGLEPYRQRLLMADIVAGGSQAFVTTHSTTVVACAGAATLWYMNPSRRISPFATRMRQHHAKDPDAFLSRLVIVAEGITEVGFARSLLEQTISPDLLPLGIWVTNGGGNDAALQLLEEISESGIAAGGFVDDEGTSQGRWAAVGAALGPLMFRWQQGSIEENVIALVPDDRLDEFVQDPEGERAGGRLRTLAERLRIADKDLAAIRAAAGSNLRELIAQASTGQTTSAAAEERKAFSKHGQHWFKCEEGGRELFAKVVRFGLLPRIEGQLIFFVNAVRGAVSLAPLASLS